jgi:YD repeat-containing protein
MNMTYDIAKRSQTESGVAAGTTTSYVQSAGYFPDGQVQFWQYGSNLWSWQSVDKMLRPWQAWATQNNNGNNWMFYDYYGFDNNSAVVSANEGFGAGVAWNSLTFMNDQYEYDGVKRLIKVTDTNYSRQYSWDEYGNLALKQNSGVPLSGLTPINGGTNPYNTANNHLPGTNYGYDARGMMTKLGAVTMAYDAEGNMKDTNDTGTGQNLTWIYDAEGQRTQKLVSGSASVLYVHDAFGQLTAEYNSTSIAASCQTCFLTYDMLGTVRLITNQSQGVVARHDYLPFAEEVFNGTAGRNGNFGAVSNVTQGFTGQEADGGTATLVSRCSET